MDDFQYYPTPPALAERLWALFKDRDFARVLDSSAGSGELEDAMPGRAHDEYHHRHRHKVPTVDCIELDATKHPLLREKGLNVVGLDFLDFEGGEIYSHIIMNPPFKDGAKHVLKGWDCLWEGEVGAIINAQTLRNPCSAERQRLVRLINDHGSVEYVSDAFKGSDVAREADVEVALVHLVKPAECAEDWIGPVIAQMSVDRNQEADVELPRELALPNSFVANQVAAFRAAVRSMREAVRMQAVANHFAARIGRTMSDLTNNRAEASEPPEAVRVELEKRYLELKDRAWASVLRSTEALAKLSAKVQKQAESQFADIQKLEFNESNVYGFLLGLVQSQPQMQLDMACDVFDQIVRYHSDNTVFYRGWRSNDKHRTCGFRIKTTRFILPGHRTESYARSLGWDSERMLADFDKVFAMLDGKSAPEVGLCDLFRQHFRELREGQRLSSSYFDVRYYPTTAGTIHFFARDKQLVDRLNRIVGRQRAWLPPEGESVPEAFWLQFDRAEKFDAQIRAEAERVARERSPGRFRTDWDHPINQFMRHEPEASETGGALLARAIDNVLAKHGLLPALENGVTLALAA